MGGRKKVYDDVEPLGQKQTVSTWLQGLKEGTHRKSALYNLARYLRWRKKKGLEYDPDIIIEECIHGTNLTLIRHLKPLIEYCEGDIFRGCAIETRKKSFKDVKSFYQSHLIILPRAKIRGREVKPQVNTEITAGKFLEFARTVLVKATLTTKARAIILLSLQSGMDQSTLMKIFNFYGYAQLANHFGTEEFARWDLDKCPVRIDLVRLFIELASKGAKQKFFKAFLLSEVLALYIIAPIASFLILSNYLSVMVAGSISFLPFFFTFMIRNDEMKPLPSQLVTAVFEKIDNRYSTKSDRFSVASQ
jgi:hypothetical protein